MRRGKLILLGLSFGGLLMVLAVLVPATTAAEAGSAGVGGPPQVQGIYEVQFMSAAEGAPERALQPGAATQTVHPGQLLIIKGMGLGPEELVVFGNQQVRPLPAPFSGENRLVVIVPRLPAGPTMVYVISGSQRSKGRAVQIAPAAGTAGDRSYAAFTEIDRLLFRASEALQAGLEELPPGYQGFARQTGELLLRDRLLALEIEGALAKLSPEELSLLDALFATTGLVPLLRNSEPLLQQDGSPDQDVFFGLQRVLEYKGQALRALGEIMDQVRITDWDDSTIASFGSQSFGRLLRGLGELDLALGGNVALIAQLLAGKADYQLHLKLSQDIAGLAAQLDRIASGVTDTESGLAAIREQLTTLSSGLSLAMDNGFSQVNNGIQGLTAIIANNIAPNLNGIIARLDSPDYGLAEIKSELAQLESQMAFTVLPSLAQLLQRPDLGPVLERLDRGVLPALSALQEAMATSSQQLNAILAQLGDPHTGLAEIKAEIRGLEDKIDRVWQCLSTLTLERVKHPGAVSRAPVDVVLAIDSSGSMKANDPQRLRIATAKRFIEELNPQTDQVGVVSWDNDIDFIQPLTDDFNRVEQMLDRIDASGATNLNVGLKAAINLFVSGRPNATKTIIFLTDGDGTYTYSNQPNSPAALAKQKNIIIYTIGLGNAPSERKLRDLAEATGGRFYRAPTAGDLRQIYTEISKQLVAPAEEVMRITCSVGG